MKTIIRLAALSAAFALITPLLVFGSSEPDANEPSPFGANWGYLYGHLGVKPRPFLVDVRELGGGFSRVVLFWQQIEPQKEKFDWSALDTYVHGLKGPDEGFVTLYSASMWATPIPANIMPAVPAKDPKDYYRFVFETVSRAPAVLSAESHGAWQSTRCVSSPHRVRKRAPPIPARLGCLRLGRSCGVHLRRRSWQASSRLRRGISGVGRWRRKRRVAPVRGRILMLTCGGSISVAAGKAGTGHSLRSWV
jgi:hypothetical protein